MTEQYYTPDVKDIFIGYEFEFCPDVFQKDAEGNRKYIHTSHEDGRSYEIRSLGRLYTIQELICSGLMRVPYLTKEQIEAEGWNFKTEYTGYYGIVFERGNSWLSFNPKEHMILIIPIDPVKEPYEYHHKYAGLCPSINEFRKLCKWLQI